MNATAVMRCRFKIGDYVFIRTIEVYGIVRGTIPPDPEDGRWALWVRYGATGLKRFMCNPIQYYEDVITHVTQEEYEVAQVMES